MRILIALAVLLPACANGLRPIDPDTGSGTDITSDTDDGTDSDAGTDPDGDTDSDTFGGGGNDGDCQLPVAGYRDNDGCFDFGDFRSSDASGTWGYHIADDYCASAGTEVVAFADGTIRSNATRGTVANNWGPIVIAEHSLSDGTVVCAIYGHVDGDSNLTAGTAVSRGDRIGSIHDGTTVLSSWANHIHFGLRMGACDDILPCSDAAGACATRGYAPAPPFSPYVDPVAFVLDDCQAPGTCPSGNGDYCGDTGLGQIADHLYACSFGAYTDLGACVGGCEVAAPGFDDTCQDGIGDCPAGNGDYCGIPTLGHNANHLYDCTNGTWTDLGDCANGCVSEAPGIDDTCADDVATCPSGNGDYCGSAARGQNTSHLYACSNANWSDLGNCDYGCDTAPPGQPDTCAAPPASCPSGNGNYCGSASLGQNTTHLYSCSNGNYTDIGTCGAGCTIASAGTNDYCATVACPSGNGLYCGATSRSQNTNHLYNCTNGSWSDQGNCTNGCATAAPGFNDYCN